MKAHLEDIAPGGRKFLEWARRELDWLVRLRADLKLPRMSKHFKIGASLIWVKSSEFGNIIRITGGEPWQVLVSLLVVGPDPSYFLDIRAKRFSLQTTTPFVGQPNAQRVDVGAWGANAPSAALPSFVDNNLNVVPFQVGTTAIFGTTHAVGPRGEALRAQAGALKYLHTDKKYVEMLGGLAGDPVNLMVAMADGEFIYGHWSWDFGGSGKSVNIWRSADMVDTDMDGVNDPMSPFVPLGHLDFLTAARGTHNDWIMQGVTHPTPGDPSQPYRIYGISGKNGIVASTLITLDPTYLAPSMKGNTDYVYGFTLRQTSPVEIIGFKTGSASHEHKLASILDTFISFNTFGGDTNASAVTNSNGYYAFSPSTNGPLYMMDYEAGTISQIYDDVGRFTIAGVLSAGTKTKPFWVGEQTVDADSTHQITFLTDTGVHLSINHGFTTTGSLLMIGATSTNVYVRWNVTEAGTAKNYMMGSDGTDVEVRLAVIAHLASIDRAWMSTVVAADGLVFDGKAYTFVRAQGVNPVTGLTDHALFHVDNTGAVAEYTLPVNAQPTVSIPAQSDYDRIRVLAL
jgi:hypothetical protein